MVLPHLVASSSGGVMWLSDGLARGSFVCRHAILLTSRGNVNMPSFYPPSYIHVYAYPLPHSILNHQIYVRLGIFRVSHNSISLLDVRNLRVMGIIPNEDNDLLKIFISLITYLYRHYSLCSIDLLQYTAIYFCIPIMSTPLRSDRHFESNSCIPVYICINSLFMQLLYIINHNISFMSFDYETIPKDPLLDLTVL